MPNPPGLLSSILEYQEGLCFFCRRPLPFDLASVDHLIPRVHGGFDHRVNLVACCRAMNYFLGPIPFDLKVRLIADQQFMAGITRWCLIASARSDRVISPPDACEARARAGGEITGQTASHFHCEDPPQGMCKGESSALFLTE
jgi:hypothetical protein